MESLLADPNGTLLLVGTVVAFTVLFDLADIRPQVGSFGFVPTGTYLVYLLFRLFIALVAAFLLKAGQPTQSPFLIGFAAVLGGVVILQGLALRIAGQDVVNLANVIQVYKNVMIEQETERAERSLQAEVLTLNYQLLQAVRSEEELRHEWQSLVFEVFRGGGSQSPAQDVTKLLAEIELIAAGDSEFMRRSFASEIAHSNPLYARLIVRRWEESGSQSSLLARILGRSAPQKS